MLRTLAVSLALTHTPKQVALYGMDLMGGSLRRIEAFPHVGGVATRSDPSRVRRLVEELGTMIETRQRIIKEHGIDSLQQLRLRHSAGELPELDAADIVVLVNGYGALRSEFDDLDNQFTHVMQQAATVGIHLVLTLTRMSELKIAHHSLFGTKVELRLNDATDSYIDRNLAKIIKNARPGRALTDTRLLAQVALPVVNLVPDDEIGNAVEALAQQVASSWSGPAAAPIRLLPLNLSPKALPDPKHLRSEVAFGLRQDTMQPAMWEFAGQDPHLIVLGDAKSGKTTALRMVAHGLMQQLTPDQLAIAVVDTRNHLAGIVPDRYLAAHARSSGEAAGLAASIAQELERRTTLSAKERERTPRVVMLVDDHDIISAGGHEHLAPLKPFLPNARDLGLNIVIARPVGGAVRALYSPVLQGLRDTGGAILLLSGDRAEGQILPRLYPEHFPPGRGRYARRGEPPFIVQVAALTEAKQGS